MLEIKLQLSSAECNCLIEAIKVANSAVESGQIVYAAGGYNADNIDEQRSHAGVTDSIANNLQQLIELEETALIVFEP